MKTLSPSHSIFGVSIDDMNHAMVVQHIQKMLEHSRCEWVATVNPEILLHARENKDYANTLCSAAMRTPDGIGLRLAAGIRHRVTGVRLAESLLTEAATQGYGVLSIVWSGGRSTAAEITQALEQKLHPDLIAVAEIEHRDHITDAEHAMIAQLIAEHDIRIVLCGLGFPYQEQLLETLATRERALKHSARSMFETIIAIW